MRYKSTVLSVLGGLLLGLCISFFLSRGLAFSSLFPNTGLGQEVSQASGSSCPDTMSFIPGGTFRMGSDQDYPEERSARDVAVSSFCISVHEITNAEFQEFVDKTGYETTAERPLSVEEFPNLSEEQRLPGSLVFQQPDQGQPVVELSWWKWTPGANWQHPDGPESSIEGKGRYPVVHVSYEDAAAYASWAGLSLPTETQWEFAAKGGLENARFTWGNTYSAKRANTWQGNFPVNNTQKDGYDGTAPVGSFSANGYGLYDMAGNVWEWTQDWYQWGHENKSHQMNPIADNPEKSFDPREPNMAKHVIKGGSYLCAKNYCSRYRPAAREAQEPNTGTSHIGFRVAKAIS